MECAEWLILFQKLVEESASLVWKSLWLGGGRDGMGAEEGPSGWHPLWSRLSPASLAAGPEQHSMGVAAHGAVLNTDFASGDPVAAFYEGHGESAQQGLEMRH